MAFAHSIGQDFQNDLLHYTNNISSNDKNSIETSYELQKRLANFWKNNDLPILLQSQKFSGEVSLNNKPEPLGGPINWCYEDCTDEFPFWSLGKKSLKSDTNNENDTNDTDADYDNKHETDKQSNHYENTYNNYGNHGKEHFTPLEVKEEFNGGHTIFIISMILLIILLISTIFVLSKK